MLSIEHFSCVSALWDGIWQVGGWALGLHTHSIPNCGWDVRRNTEGLAGQHQVPLLRTSWDLGRHLRYLLPQELEESRLIPKTHL